MVVISNRPTEYVDWLTLCEHLQLGFQRIIRGLRILLGECGGGYNIDPLISCLGWQIDKLNAFVIKSNSDLLIILEFGFKETETKM